MIKVASEVKQQNKNQVYPEISKETNYRRFYIDKIVYLLSFFS